MPFWRPSQRLHHLSRGQKDSSVRIVSYIVGSQWTFLARNRHSPGLGQRGKAATSLLTNYSVGRSRAVLVLGFRGRRPTGQGRYRLALSTSTRQSSPTMAGKGS